MKRILTCRLGLNGISTAGAFFNAPIECHALATLVGETPKIVQLNPGTLNPWEHWVFNLSGIVVRRDIASGLSSTISFYFQLLDGAIFPQTPFSGELEINNIKLSGELTEKELPLDGQLTFKKHLGNYFFATSGAFHTSIIMRKRRLSNAKRSWRPTLESVEFSFSELSLPPHVVRARLENN